MNWPWTGTGRIRELETRMRQLELEWEETYDKVRRVLAKLARRDEREAQAAPDLTTSHHSDDGKPSLTAHQLEMQAKILSRRSRAVSNGQG